MGIPRVILGKHPLSSVLGVYVTRDGFNVENADPDNVAHAARFAVNTRWPQQANILQAGTCNQGATVTHPALGGSRIPYVLFHRLLGGTGYDPHEISRQLRTNDTGLVVLEAEHMSRWRVTHFNTTSFKIDLHWVKVPDPTTGATFKYIVFNCPVK